MLTEGSNKQLYTAVAAGPLHALTSQLKARYMDEEMLHFKKIIKEKKNNTMHYLDHFV